MKRFAFLASTLFGLAACDYETVAQLQPPANPEAVAVRLDGSLLVSDALTGRVLTVDPDTGDVGTLATLPLGQCAPNPFPPIMGALDLDLAGNAYITVNACDPANRGVWKIQPDGTASLHAPYGPDVLGNGLTVADDQVFVVDTFSDRLWSAPLSGGPASVFVTSPLFAPSGDLIPGTDVPKPGGNGLERYDAHSLVLANSSTGGIVRVPLDGSAPSLMTTSQPGCDDIAVDIQGRVLCTTDAFQTLTVINPSTGVTKTVFDAFAEPDDKTFAPMDGPTDVTCLGKRCYVSNAAFPFFPGTGNGPSIATFEWITFAR